MSCVTACSQSDYHFLCVIVIARNEEKFIGKCLDSCISALEEFDDYRIILVDSMSSDSTIRIAEKYDIDIYQLTDEKLLSAAAGRYIGSIHSDSRYVFYIDGDMIVDRNWFNCAIPFMESNPLIQGLGGLRPDMEDSVSDHHMVISPCPDKLKFDYVRILDGGAALFRRTALKVAGYHNPFLRSGEEAELSLRLQNGNFKLARAEIPMIHHLGIVKYQGVAFERVKYYTGVGQILRSYFLKSKASVAYKHSFKYILNVLFMLMNLILIIAGFVFNGFFLLLFAGLNLTILISVLVTRRNAGMAFTSLIKFYMKGYYILKGFFRGLKRQELYPQDVKIIKKVNNS